MKPPGEFGEPLNGEWTQSRMSHWFDILMNNRRLVIVEEVESIGGLDQLERRTKRQYPSSSPSFR